MSKECFFQFPCCSVPQTELTIFTTARDGFPSGLNTTHLTASGCPISVTLYDAVSTSHSLMVVSSLPLRSVFPSGLNATLLMESSKVCIVFSGPVRVCLRLPVCASQRKISPKSPPVAIIFPSGLNAKHSALPIRSMNGILSASVSKSHRRIPSRLPLASVFPSGLNAKPLVQAVDPEIVFLCFFVCTSHR